MFVRQKTVYSRFYLSQIMYDECFIPKLYAEYIIIIKGNVKRNMKVKRHWPFVRNHYWIQCFTINNDCFYSYNELHCNLYFKHIFLPLPIGAIPIPLPPERFLTSYRNTDTAGSIFRLPLPMPVRSIEDTSSEAFAE